MPVVKVYMWKGRTAGEKRQIIKGITEAFEKIGVAKENTTVIITDVDKENWGSAGEQASMRK